MSWKQNTCNLIIRYINSKQNKLNLFGENLKFEILMNRSRTLPFSKPVNDVILKGGNNLGDVYVCKKTQFISIKNILTDTTTKGWRQSYQGTQASKQIFTTSHWLLVAFYPIKTVIKRKNISGKWQKTDYPSFDTFTSLHRNRKIFSLINVRPPIMVNKEKCNVNICLYCKMCLLYKLP